jgi:transcriptional regulator with XRE-family HTH domain
MFDMTKTASRGPRVPGGVDGTRMRRLRVQAGMSALALGQKAGASVQHICDIERGRRSASPLLLRRIANALDTTSAVLMREEATRVNG